MIALAHLREEIVMEQSNEEILSDCLNQCTEALFEAYGSTMDCKNVATKDVPTRIENGADIAGIIGLVDDGVRGNITIATTGAVLEATCPGENHRDWIGELANQLLGRTKNKLLIYGLDLKLSPPVAITGENLRVQGTRGSSVIFHHYECAHGPVLVWFVVKIDPEIHLTKSEDPDAQPHDEGELLLF